MGLFSKLKQNFTHGGVKVKLDAPASVSMQQPTLDVQVTVTATDAPQTIKSVRAVIIALNRNQAFSGPSNQTMNNSQAPMVEQQVARADNTESFTLAAGQSKTVPISIIMNAGAQMANHSSGGLGQAAQALQKIESFSEAMNPNSYTYFLQGVADVDGIAIDPSVRQPLQILKPGEVGGAVNIHL